MYNTKDIIDKILKSKKVKFNLNEDELISIAVEKEGAEIASNGALSINTGKYTGRSPNDRFIVDEDSVRDHINWNNQNKAISRSDFENLFKRISEYIKDKELYVFEGFVGSDDEYKMPIRVINELSSQNLFAKQMFIENKDNDFKEDFTVIALPELKINEKEYNINSEAFIIISFEEKLVLIGGTKYSGEIKKSMFTVMNYLLPFKNVLPMHCSANRGKKGDVALFFGLSGTGKTTLSADNDRKLIGDDEHGFTEDGVFNFEGGCYAKCIDLSCEKEPQIYSAIRKGAILENVVLDEDTKEPDYSNGMYTENTRVAFPVEHIDDAILEGKGEIPKNIIFLTADATGVLPPISKLTKEQAMYHFMSGYTSKLAGTERGIKEPTATFSACFGEPFMLLKPQVYAELLGEKIEKHNLNVFLVNTGWTGGEYGKGSRINLKYTRAMVRAALNGDLENVEYKKDEIFNLSIPLKCSGVPEEILIPSNTWEDKERYNKKANKLNNSFIENFKKFEVNEKVRAL
ncbi:MAG: phosphoenolpyruvate carboxykinase (ATP) [Senegalia sp. (in: firmicutes)]|uniref:phosphoenolpyruvate carboxykinase (ATP) n=1 Tax=Senegalia sp. (in: firmicutes) TaxID=1924098 RepID=UPI003F975374